MTRAVLLAINEWCRRRLGSRQERFMVFLSCAVVVNDGEGSGDRASREYEGLTKASTTIVTIQAGLLAVLFQ
eukprot:scaffold21131_cov194-Skeletonema_marinoi.AAC.1